ncbi:MAG: ASCH domain-containing protein [Candidatus Aenigmarchaeota archaeon]|nr:ASCH domain-containing protein [Candidatus Aenigmarchaeota archaeon]
MHHVAIMRKSWKLTQKILSGEKKIESRWYNTKYPPWDRIKKGDIVYFKDSGEPVKLKAGVEKALQFSDLNEKKIKDLLELYARYDGIEDRKNEFFHLFRNKKYCILIFLKNPQVIEPFEISKKGFGTMASWICIEDIEKIIVGSVN